MTAIINNSFFVFFILLVVLGAVFIMLPSLTNQTVALESQVYTTEAESLVWFSGANISSDLTIREHARKHGNETWEIYNNILTGKCAAATKYCGGSDIEYMYLCVDPVTGLVGAILQFGNEITTGFYESNSGYWERRVSREGWDLCPD